MVSVSTLEPAGALAGDENGLWISVPPGASKALDRARYFRIFNVSTMTASFTVKQYLN